MICIGAWAFYTHAVNTKVEALIKQANTDRHIIVQEYKDKIDVDNAQHAKDVQGAYEQGQIDMKGKIKDVSKKVTKVADAQCTTTLGFMQSYAAAFNLPVVPIAASKSIDSPSGISISDIARADTLNGAIAADYKRETLAWREWFVRNKTAFDGFCAKSKSCQAPTDPK